MGERGPVPKRNDQRAGHRTKAESPDRVQAHGSVDIPAADDDWHPDARDWYQSLAESGQARFYEPSDWQHARFLARLMTELLTAERPSSEMAKTVLAGMQDLGVTESARRRMKIEVDRRPDQPKAAGGKVTAMSSYRRKATDG